MADEFAVRVAVRSYEVDANGHVNHAVYHQYGEHARMEHLRVAGCSPVRLNARGWGVILLETHARFLSELLLGEQVEVSSRVAFGTGKTFRIEHVLRRVPENVSENGAAPDARVAAEISCRMGLLDMTARRLVADPAARLAEVATEPALLGLGSG
ncbi:acyl-CoA thioesterase [Pseudonocardia acidicola]|uniref:Acyl-CoA thioesterase n=1 Tax=Pseudonocardia acidicola TaxID=2724939 RepID=A0ABX1SND1_9PSEU|nr:acyl-CoA thioesterase [Pseudonocardia acidicola]NMI02064.1 acyl-CoA thioesterase [Pseudonocardia acidicola]